MWNTGETSSTIKVKPDKTTAYTVIGTRGGCSNEASVTVNVKPSPTVTVTADPSILNILGLSSTLSASGAQSYVWNTGATGSSIIITPLLTTTYSVVGSATNGCIGNATVTVTVKLF